MQGWGMVARYAHDCAAHACMIVQVWGMVARYVHDCAAHACIIVQGWGVVARQRIARGTFVSTYSGEYITTAQAAARLKQYDSQPFAQGHALLVRRRCQDRVG